MATVEGKIAVITGSGGSLSIGRATARLFAQRGAKVVLAHINEIAVKQTVKDLAGEAHDVRGVPTDVASFALVQALADAAWDHYSRAAGRAWWT
jgi:NAD(P)-dependent dehydrogenase (short-subunit alcohol dehydrogenase family)